jgi:2-amino-4-hydroxy-6-hydroxymethyldihydropteridine diphosphokinase
MAIVHIGIGSNLGERQANCRRAVERLRQKGITMRKVSSLYETEPWGVDNQPLFINMAVEAETPLSPEDLLYVLKEIEREAGRQETIKWGPRVVDLDILLYEERIIDNEQLRIPHPYMHQRGFVLLPLAEIAPDTIHPVVKKTIRELKEELRGA